MTVLNRIVPDRSQLPVQLPIGDVAFLDTLGLSYYSPADTPAAKADSKPEPALSALDRMFAYFGSDRA